MSGKLASILIPTRNRFDSLLKAINSIVNTTKDLSRVEILIRFDEDDESSISRIKELPTDEIDINIIIGKRYKYEELHRYVNEMCEETKGEFIVWFNDDCIIQSNGWDDIIAEYIGKTICFYPNNKKTGSGNIFPIISRKIYETLGHFSLSQQVDTWQAHVCNKAGLEIRRDDLVFIHNRKQSYVSDENRQSILNKTRRVWNKTKKKRLEDVEKLKKKFGRAEKPAADKKKKTADKKKVDQKTTKAQKKVEDARKAARAARWRKDVARKEAAKKKAEETEKIEEAKKAARAERWKKAAAKKEAEAARKKKK